MAMASPYEVLKNKMCICILVKKVPKNKFYIFPIAYAYDIITILEKIEQEVVAHG